jgi:hypothetical protein
MSNKNPFEIRTDLLSMAKDYLDKQQELAWDFQKQAIERLNENTTDVVKFLEKNQPKTYSINDLISKANEMYNFVSKK